MLLAALLAILARCTTVASASWWCIWSWVTRVVCEHSFESASVPLSLFEWVSDCDRDVDSWYVLALSSYCNLQSTYFGHVAPVLHIQMRARSYTSLAEEFLYFQRYRIYILEWSTIWNGEKLQTVIAKPLYLHEFEHSGNNWGWNVNWHFQVS